MRYIRTHLATGVEQTFEFNESHDAAFSMDNVLPKERVTTLAKAWVNAWNVAHAGHWSFRLVEEEAADAHTV